MLRIEITRSPEMVRIAIMHIVLRCRTGSLSCCLEVDFGVEVATWSCPLRVRVRI